MMLASSPFDLPKLQEIFDELRRQGRADFTW